MRRDGRGQIEVEVIAPGRLHIGFLDLNGGLGRRFGSIGLAIDQPEVRLRLRHSDTMAVVAMATGGWWRGGHWW